MDARKWWVVYGVGAPQLQSLALKLLGHPTSSSCCEKNWGTYSFVRSLDKNPMDPKRALDLVFVHNNLRLLSRRSSQYNQGESKMWDIAGDAFDLSEKGLMKMANLSLDEPEMERAFFMDELGGADRVLMLA
jgi:hAT family C-terminal dimerisation region